MNAARIDRILAVLLFSMMAGFTAVVIASGDAPWPMLVMLVIGWLEVAALAWILLAAMPAAERLDERDNAMADTGRWDGEP